MHVLILNWRDRHHPLAGGAELSLYEHAQYWLKKGARVTWISSGFLGAKKTKNDKGIKIVRFGSHYTVHLYAYFYYKNNLSKDCDLVIDCFHGLPFFTPLFIPRNKIIALINEPAKEVWFKNLIWPLGLLAFHIEPYFFKPYKDIPFITSADSIVSELTELGIKRKMIALIPHGITVSKISEAVEKEKYPTFLYLSQLSKDKGIEDALYAFSSVEKKKSTARMWVVGKPVSEKYEDFLKNLVKKLSIDNVFFFGYVSENKKYDLMGKAWILIHPSIREGWGLNVIEANRYGTPAIGYNVTGLRDSIQHKKTGLLTSKNTPESLARSMVELINDKKSYLAYKKYAIQWANSFNWESAGEKSWQLIKGIYAKSQ